jgi:hypothetical protein
MTPLCRIQSRPGSSVPIPGNSFVNVVLHHRGVIPKRIRTDVGQPREFFLEPQPGLRAVTFRERDPEDLVCIIWTNLPTSEISLAFPRSIRARSSIAPYRRGLKFVQISSFVSITSPGDSLLSPEQPKFESSCFAYHLQI